MFAGIYSSKQAKVSCGVNVLHAFSREKGYTGIQLLKLVGDIQKNRSVIEAAGDFGFLQRACALQSPEEELCFDSLCCVGSAWGLRAGLKHLSHLHGYFAFHSMHTTRETAVM